MIKYNKKIGDRDTFVVSIDDLCNIYGVDIGNPKDKKKYITKVLNNMIKDLSNMKFQWQYIKNGGRYAYFVEFKFSDETLEYFDEQLKAVFFKQLYSELRRMYILSGNDESIQHFNNMQDKLKNLDKKKYMEWIFTDDDDNKVKIKIFNETYLKVYGVEYNPDENYLF